jgi:hypothetical protein
MAHVRKARSPPPGAVAQPVDGAQQILGVDFAAKDGRDQVGPL